MITKHYFWISLEKQPTSLLTTRDVSRGEMSVPQQQKFHNDDVNQCLHNIFLILKLQGTKCTLYSCSILSFSWSLLNEHQQNTIYSTNIACFVIDSLH